MDGSNTEKQNLVPVGRNLRPFNKQFKNPPQPHMCIQDSLKDSSEKLYINVLAWQKIASPKHFTDPIPLYGGMQVPQVCPANSTKPPLLVFAVMVNPEILKANGKYAATSVDRDALVNLLCDFVEAMNPGLHLARNPHILKDKDIAGELKDVWFAVQNKREKEKGLGQDYMYKVYDIDGLRDGQEMDQTTNVDTKNSYDQNNCTANSYQSECYNNGPLREPTNSTGWDDFSKQDMSIIRTTKVDRSVLKHYESKKSNTNDFFPTFGAKPLRINDVNSKAESNELQTNDNQMVAWMEGINLDDSSKSNGCDNKNISSIGS